MASLLLPILHTAKGYFRVVIVCEIIYCRRRSEAQKIRGLEIIKKI